MSEKNKTLDWKTIPGVDVIKTGLSDPEMWKNLKKHMQEQIHKVFATDVLKDVLQELKDIEEKDKP